MAQKHDILFTEKPMTVGTHEQGPQKRYRRLRFPSFDSVVWAEKNPLLQKGELGHEKDTGRFKVGDGVTYWVDLPYNSVGESAKVNGYNVLEIVAGKNVEIEQNDNVLTIGASGVGYSKQEIDDKFTVVNDQIDANADAIQKTRDDMNAEDGRLQTQITAQATEIANKQDKLTAGDNIIISGNVISATGGGGITEVVHDDTLTGNGTTDSPLSVVGGGTGTVDYTQLLNKPEINGNVLTGNKTASQLGFATVATSGKYSDLSNKPTINDLTTTAQQNAINSTITSSLVSSYSNHIADTDIHVTAEQKTAWSNKQDSLVSGTNIKTINNNSLLGSGNINIDSLPEQTGNAGKVLTTDGTTASWQEPAGGTKVIFREWE